MKPRVIIYAVCMLLTGSINTIATKWQDMTIYQGVPFQHPAFQSAAMFLGESLCLIPYFLLRWRRRQMKQAQLGLAADPVKAARPRSYYVRRTLAFLVPTLCDAIATTLLNLGLFYTYASTYQMLRGTLVLFAGILTVTILRRRLYAHHWVGLVLIVAGAAIVGAASLLAAPEEGSAAVAPGPHPPAMEAGTASQPLLSGLAARGLLGSTQGGEGLHLGLLRLRHALLAGGQQGYSAAGNTAPLFGDALVVLAQGFAALQFILEEKFLGTYRMQPLLAVGIEGAWGVLLCLGALPLLTYVKLPNGRPLDDASAAFQALAHQPGLRAAVAVSVLSIGVFNFFGLSVTAALSGSARATIDATRTLFIWLFSLAAGWESFHELQVVGFAVLLAGKWPHPSLFLPVLEASSSLYNEILRSCLPVRRALPKPGDPEWGPDSDDEEEGAVTEALLDAQGLVGPALPPSLQPEGLAPREVVNDSDLRQPLLPRHSAAATLQQSTASGPNGRSRLGSAGLPTGSQAIRVRGQSAAHPAPRTATMARSVRLGFNTLSPHDLVRNDSGSDSEDVMESLDVVDPMMLAATPYAGFLDRGLTEASSEADLQRRGSGTQLSSPRMSCDFEEGQNAQERPSAPASRMHTASSFAEFLAARQQEQQQQQSKT
ncbi:hypothetical protein QJQ45_019531 [Haematococcus lacustris]|nr:hypothetical protein QJQ45_019531 [Haematococcus lacustris]